MNSKIRSVKKQSIDWSVAFVITLITIVDRLYNISRMGLWPDEVFTAVIARPGISFIEVIKGALATPIPAPPFIYIVSHIWMKIFGFDDVTIRIPFVIAGALGIPVIYLVGKTLFNKRVGFISGILLFFSAMHVFHSREARYYPFLMLFSMLSIYFLHQGMELKERKWWVGYIIISILNLYTFHTALFVLAAQGIYVFCLALIDFSFKKIRDLQAWKKSDLSYYMMSIGIITFLYIPMAPFLIKGLAGSQGFSPGGTPVRLKSKFILEDMFFAYLKGQNKLFFVYIILFLAGLVLSLKSKSKPIISLLFIVSLPFLFMQLISINHWIEFKYLIFVLPALLIIISVGIENFATFLSIAASIDDTQIPIWENLLAVLMLVGVFSINYPYYEDGFIQNTSYWREQGEFINQLLLPNDIFVTFNMASSMTMHPSEMFSVYFDPENNNQKEVLIISTPQELSELLNQYDHVFFHHAPVGNENLKEIFSWIKDTTHIKLKFGSYTMIYIGKDTSRDELYEHVKKYKFFIAPDVD